MEHELEMDAINLDAMTNAVCESVLPSTNTASRFILSEYVESWENRYQIRFQELHTSLDEAVLSMNQFRMTIEDLTRVVHDSMCKILANIKEEDIPIEDSSDLEEFLQSINIKPNEQR